MYKTRAWAGLLGSYLFLLLWAFVVIYSMVDGPASMFGMAFIGFVIWGGPGLTGIWLSRGAATYPLISGLTLLLLTFCSAFAPAIMLYSRVVPLGLAGLFASSLIFAGAIQALWSGVTIFRQQHYKIS